MGIRPLFLSCEQAFQKAKVFLKDNNNPDFAQALKEIFTQNTIKGRALAQQSLSLERKKTIEYKTKEAKSQLEKMLELAFSFFGNKEKLQLKPKEKSKIETGLFRLAEDFAKELEKYRVGAVDLFNKIKNRITLFNDAGAGDALAAFDMQGDIYAQQKTIDQKTALENFSNPLLDYDELPHYEKVQAEHIIPALKEAERRARQIIYRTLKLNQSFDTNSLTLQNTLMALSQAEAIFAEVENYVELLRLVNNKEGMKEIDREIDKIITNFSNYLANDKDIVQLKTKYFNSPDAQTQTGANKKLIIDEMRRIRLSGALLETEEKARFNEINHLLADLSTRFKNNLIDSRQDLLITDEAKLAGLTENDKNILRKNANSIREYLENKLKALYCDSAKAQLEAKERIPTNSFLITSNDTAMILSRLDDKETRKQFWYSLQNRCNANSSFGILKVNDGRLEKELDNTQIAEQIFELKQEQANLLGFKSLAEVSMISKMAATTKTVESFLKDLIEPCIKQAKEEYQELVAFQKEISYENTEGDPTQIYPWDEAYLAEKLKKARYDFDKKELQAYFEFNQTLAGMLKLADRVFGVKFTRIKNKREDIFYFNVTDSNTKKKLGSLLIDPFERINKRKGAGHRCIRKSYNKADGTRVLPISVIFSYLHNTKDSPLLLEHGQVKTLFHEFGHALHSLLSTAQHRSQSGTSVKRDFVELPSQLMEEFLYDRDTLKSFAKHYQNQGLIPDELIDKLIKAKKFRKASEQLNHLNHAKMDFDLYNQSYNPENKYTSPLKLSNRIMNRLRVGPKILDKSFFINRFQHIFVGGYSAGYYSYLWSEALLADAFAQFTKNGTRSAINPEIGRKYRENILSVGASIHEREAYKNFTGKEFFDINSLMLS